MFLRCFCAVSALGLLVACGEGPQPPMRDATAPEAPVAQDAPAPAQPAPAAEPEFVQPERTTVSQARTRIDWAAARTDMAASSETSESMGFQIQSGDLAPPVPVLLPTGIVTPESAPGEAPRFRELPDGYFARYPGIEYDITVSGTNEVYDAGGSGSEDGVSAPVFRTTATGAIVSLSRYGADYMIEFECNGAAGAFGDTCIEEGEALDVAGRLVIAGTR